MCAIRSLFYLKFDVWRLTLTLTFDVPFETSGNLKQLKSSNTDQLYDNLSTLLNNHVMIEIKWIEMGKLKSAIIKWFHANCFFGAVHWPPVGRMMLYISRRFLRITINDDEHARVRWADRLLSPKKRNCLAIFDLMDWLAHLMLHTAQASHHADGKVALQMHAPPKRPGVYWTGLCVQTDS